jgi:hypothetical protein
MFNKRAGNFVWLTLAVLVCIANSSTLNAQNIRLRANRDPAVGFNTIAKYADVTADDNIAVMGSYFARGAWIYDVSNGDNPVLKSHYNPGNNQQFLEAVVVGNRAYFGSGNNAAGNGGVHIVDITNPANPTLLGRVSAANNGYDTVHEIFVDGNYLYINSNTTANRNLKVFNISNPTQPQYVRDIVPNNNGWVHGLYVKNNRLYLTGFFGTGLTEIYDITNMATEAPRLLGQVVTGPATHSNWVSEDGNWMFVCREFVDGELRVYNISNPAAPQLVKIIKAADIGINGIAPHNPVVKDNRLYVSWYQAGVQVFDITNPAEPKRLGQYDTFSPAFNEQAAREGAESLVGEPWDVVCGSQSLLNAVPNTYDGNWTAYPLLGHDKVISSDLATGLYILDASRIGAPAKNNVADFNGDGKTDFSRFNPANGMWTIERSGNLLTFSTFFGTNGDTIRPGDYDGDNRSDIAVTRIQNNSLYWYIQNSSNDTFRAEQFGSAGDIPVSADYDKDGRTDIAVFRPSNGTWYIQQSALGFKGVQWGTNGDQPITGDFDADGKTDIAVVRSINGLKNWFVLPSSMNGLQAFQFGLATDKTVIGDFDGDFKTDLAVFRPDSGTWFVQNSRTNQMTSIQFGVAEDMPIPADYDGDGKTDIAVFRPSANAWYGLNSTNGAFFGRVFGANGEVPAPSSLQPR